MRPFVHEQLRRIANRSTVLVAKGVGAQLGMVLVSGYPKSGTSWLSFLLADYLGLPRPDDYVLPVAMPSVIHSHARYSSRLQPVVYLYRDGRDVMVSYYFFRMARLDDPAKPQASRAMRRRYADVFGEHFDPADVHSNLPGFIRSEMDSPRDVRINWPQHIREWMMPRRSHVTYLAYEQLLHDPPGELARVIEALQDKPVDTERLKATVQRHEFPRRPGGTGASKDPQAFARKGVAGDWRNHFTREAAETFDAYAGSELIALGYEPDRSWVEQCPPRQGRP